MTQLIHAKYVPCQFWFSAFTSPFQVQPVVSHWKGVSMAVSYPPHFLYLTSFSQDSCWPFESECGWLTVCVHFWFIILYSPGICICSVDKVAGNRTWHWPLVSFFRLISSVWMFLVILHLASFVLCLLNSWTMWIIVNYFHAILYFRNNIIITHQNRPWHWTSIPFNCS